MKTYEKLETNYFGRPGIQFTKDGVNVKAEIVPPEVLEKFEFTDKVRYDDMPDKPRCLFCEAPATRKRLVTGVMVDMDDYHYHNKNIGKIVAQLRLLKEQGEKEDGQQRKRQVTHRRKRQRSVRQTSS